MINKAKQTQQVVCPCCTGENHKYHVMLCATDANGDIIIRCKQCKTDINVSKLLREKT